MLKFLTHKLRTHSINEDNNYTEKADEDHDSGTESDEEIDDPDLPSVVMSVERMSSVSPADTGCSMESPAPTDDQQHDPHSSEEELEVINSNKPPHHHNHHHHHHHPLHQHSSHAPNRPLRATSAVCLPEKRKWSQVGGDTSSESTMTTTTQVATPLFSSSRATNKYTPENEENMSHYGNLSPSSSCSPCHHNKYYNNSGEDGIRDGIHIAEHSGSSDEEVHHLLASMATPVQFRTSPPLEAVKPGKKPTSTTTTTPIPITIPIATTTAHGTTVPPTLLNMVRSLSPPPSKLLHYEMSPRKRSKHARHSHTTVHQQRPYLDFEKMQNLKARSVRTWRHSGDHGGELSVFCW